eukprot:2347903-Prymnesium_polylepis.1
MAFVNMIRAARPRTAACMLVTAARTLEKARRQIARRPDACSWTAAARLSAKKRRSSIPRPSRWMVVARARQIISLVTARWQRNADWSWVTLRAGTPLFGLPLRALSTSICTSLRAI